MNSLKTGLVCAITAIALTSTVAQADVLTVGGGWDAFYFGPADIYAPIPSISSLYDAQGAPVQWTFTLAAPAFLKVTDAYFTGDWFDFTINGVAQQPTSDYTYNPDFQPDFDQAFNDPNFSHAAYYLQAGDYLVTGLALNSPYGAGAAGIELSSNVPEPAAWAMMLIGVGGIGALARRRGRKAVAAA